MVVCSSRSKVFWSKTHGHILFLWFSSMSSVSLFSGFTLNCLSSMPALARHMIKIRCPWVTLMEGLHSSSSLSEKHSWPHQVRSQRLADDRGSLLTAHTASPARICSRSGSPRTRLPGLKGPLQGPGLCSGNTLASPALFVYWGSQRPGSLCAMSSPVKELSMDSVNWKLRFSVKK